MSLNQTTIGSDNGLSPVRCQAILWTHADPLSLSNEPLATNLSEISMKMNMFAFKKMYFKMSCAKWWPFYHSSPCAEYTMILSLKKCTAQATGLMHRHQGWNHPARFVSHLHEIFIYKVVYSFCLFYCLFIIVTWWYMWCIVCQVAAKEITMFGNLMFYLLYHATVYT